MMRAIVIDHASENKPRTSRSELIMNPENCIKEDAVNSYQVLEHGTRDEHVATLRRAKSCGVRSVWSGDIRRNDYLRENLSFAEREGFVRLTEYESDQESGWDIQWLDHPELAG